MTDEGAAQLARLTRLGELAFGGEAGSDAAMARLDALTNLKVLQVYGAWFTNAGLAPLPRMARLAQFFVSDTTSVTPNGLTHLQQRRPTLDMGVNGTGQVPPARTNLLRGAVGPGAIAPTRPLPPASQVDFQFEGGSELPSAQCGSRGRTARSNGPRE